MFLSNILNFEKPPMCVSPRNHHSWIFPKWTPTPMSTPWSPFPSAPDILKDPPPETSEFPPKLDPPDGVLCAFFVKPKKNLENCKGKFFRVGRTLKLFEYMLKKNRLEELNLGIQEFLE